MKKYMNENINARIADRLRSRFNAVVSKESKQESVLDLVGCSKDHLKKHLEDQFLDGMTWDNYGLHGWHIDHIKPCAAFELSDLDQQIECFHYTNLQPLWAKDNLRKGSSYNDNAPV